jgi:maltose alpha-D-glucosyltransferase/alpha-amylase
LLNYTRALLELRHAHPALASEGEYRPLVSETADAPWVYERIGGGERFLVALNPAAVPHRVELPGHIALTSVFGYGEASFEHRSDGVTELILGPVSARIWREG